MKNAITITLCLVVAQQAMSQLPEDALRMGWSPPAGTARSQAIGGALGSLGGEINSIFVNPAGLGFFKVSEMVLTPGFTLAKSDANYRGTAASSNNLTRFNMNMIGFVAASNTPRQKWRSNAFTIAVNRTANFNSTMYYKGNNNESSGSEAYAIEFAKSRVPIDDVYSSSLSLATKMAVYTYLIDTTSKNGPLEVITRPEDGLDSVNQENKVTTRGGITELAFGYAANMEDKLYIGASLGIPIVSYEKTSTYTETDPDRNNKDNNFGSYRYEERYKQTGAGFNIKFGMIYKPATAVRVGVAIHSPTFYGLKEKVTAKMVTDVEKLFQATNPNDKGVDSITSDYYYGDRTPSFKYNMTGPWKFMVSGTYLFHAVEDVRDQRGFITADVEYVTHGSSRFNVAEQEDGVQIADDYYKELNGTIKDLYKSAFNFRVGAELKLNVIALRGGFAYYGNPYKDSQLKAYRMTTSTGIGYRNKGIFIDLTWVQSFDKDVNFPYRLEDKKNTYADIKGKNKNIFLTFGFKI